MQEMKEFLHVVKEMEEELGAGNKKPEILPKLAQYELTLKGLGRGAQRLSENMLPLQANAGLHSRHSLDLFLAMSISRLTAQGIPVSCEVDIYGALSEFIGTVVSNDTVTLLDINNTVPNDMYNERYRRANLIIHRRIHLWDSIVEIQHLSKLVILRDEVPDDYGTIHCLKKLHRVHWKVISCQEILHSIVCRAHLTTSFVLILHRVRSFRLQHVHLVLSVFLQFRRWEDSTATY